MSYLAFARKYRPQNFAAVAAQEFVTTTLQNAISMDRVSHAYLFTGPRGVGKTSTARIFAKALNCLNLQGASPCGECENCMDITAGTSMDVIEIDAASNRGVDEIRSLRENVKFVPVKSKYKIYIIDEVHMLTKEAFNALLKTLEEPPSFAIFIFATTDAQKLPATILSRCQRYEFKKIPYEEMFANLAEILKAENIEYEDDALNFIIRNSDGCMRDALSILDQVVAYSGGKADAQSAAFLTGVSDKILTDKIFAAILQEKAADIPKLTEEIDGKGMDFPYVAECLAEHTRNMLFIVVTGAPPSKELTKSEIDFYTSLKKYASQERLYAVFQIFQKLSQDMKYCDFPRYVFEFAAFKGASISKIVPLPKTFIGSGEETSKEDNDQDSALPQATVTESQKENRQDIEPDRYVTKEARPSEEKSIYKQAEPPIPQPVIIEEVLAEVVLDEIDRSEAAEQHLMSEDIWQKASTQIELQGGPVASNLACATLVSANPEKITISFPHNREFQYNYFKRPDKRDLIQKAITDIAGNNAPRIEFVIEKKEEIDKKKVSSNLIENFKERQIKKNIRNDPMIAAVIEEMGGEIESVDFFDKKEDEENKK